jgi:hypothetical protein
LPNPSGVGIFEASRLTGTTGSIYAAPLRSNTALIFSRKSSRD